jgi:large subunit ribosomal protein L9
MIRLPQGPLKAAGEYRIDVALHSDVLAHINVSVIGEQ